MKKLHVATGVIAFALIVSGCGASKTDELTSDAGSTGTASTTVDQGKKNEDKSTLNSNDIIGKVDIVGEKTKQIGRFEITLEGGTVQEKLVETNGKSQPAVEGQILVIKAKVKSLAEGLNNELYEFTAYDINESDLASNNFIGYTTGVLGESLEANLKLGYFNFNEPQEGYFYFDVKKRDAYRLKYKEDEKTFGYWDIKITP